MPKMHNSWKQEERKMMSHCEVEIMIAVTTDVTKWGKRCVSVSSSVK